MDQQQQQWNTTNQPFQYQPPPPPPILPPGWISVIDPVSRRTYYANSSTGQTSWEPPVLPPPPPLPPSHHILPPHPANQLTPVPTFPYQNSQPYAHNVNNTTAMTTSTHVIGNTGSILRGTNTTTPTTHHVTTLQTAGLFIPAVRAIVQNSQNEQNNNINTNINTNANTDNNKLEFSELSGGVIADLARVQLEHDEEEEEDNDDDKNQSKLYYQPLRPLDLPIASRAPHIEPGRVDIRVMSLMGALGKI